MTSKDLGSGMTPRRISIQPERYDDSNSNKDDADEDDDDDDDHDDDDDDDDDVNR